jgi:hypothetical protein
MKALVICVTRAGLGFNIISPVSTEVPGGITAIGEDAGDIGVNGLGVGVPFVVAFVGGTGAAVVGLGVGAAVGGLGVLFTDGTFVGFGVGAPLTGAAVGGTGAKVTGAAVGFMVRRGVGGDTANAMSGLGLARNVSMTG